MPKIFRLTRLCLLATALLLHGTLAVAKPLVKSPLAEAQSCYGNGDLACVLRVLAPVHLSESEEPERLRLLAFCAARLDRHEEARQYFTAWLQLNPQNTANVQHKLDRATTPPQVYQDYTAALLATKTDQFDWQPQIENHVVVAPLAVTPSDLPHFAPPPRMENSVASRMSFLLGLNVSLPVTAQSSHWTPVQAMLAGGLALELDLPAYLKIGVAAGGWQRPNGTGGGEWNPYSLFRAGIGGRWGDHGLDLLLGAGVVLSATAEQVIGTFAPALRYHWRPATQLVGVYAELASETLFASAGTQEIIGISLGVLLKSPTR